MEGGLWERQRSGRTGGASSHAPENTLPAFRKAIEAGADGIELDVQLTKDGRIVICHDERIDRTSDGMGWIKDFTLEELRAFSFAKVCPEHGRVGIPTLEEFLALVRPTGLAANIELKTGMVYYDGLEEKTAAMVREFDMGERVIYSSFNHYSLWKLRESFPEVSIGLLMGRDFVDVPEYPRRLHAVAVHPPEGIVTEEYVRKCHDHGIKVHAWTTDSPKRMEELVRMGVDAFITNCPETGRKAVDA